MSSPPSEAAELSLTSVIEQLRCTERLLTTERAARAGLEVQLGTLAQERIRLLHLLRRCRGTVLYGNQLVDSTLIEDLQKFDQATLDHELSRAGLIYADYLANIVEPIVAAREAEAGKNRSETRAARAFLAFYLFVTVIILTTCGAS